MALTGQQVKQIQDALLDGYDEAGLRQMVRVGLNVDLDQVAGGDNFTEVVFNLVQWADRQNRVQDLITGALVANPSNTQLIALHQEAVSWHLEPPAEGEPPYQGLQYFGVEDADRFFGRESLTAELVGYLRDHRFLAVIGASGSGKSSVVRAGVAPALMTGKPLADGTPPPKGSTGWLRHIVTPTAHPLKALSASLTKGAESVTAQATLMDDMKRDVRSLDLFVSRMLADSPANHLLLVVDQFEELFTLCKDADERRQFVDNLLAAAQPEGVVTVIVTLRADFYHRCAEFDDLRAALESQQKYIGAMSQDELRSAIEQPAELGKWDFEPGLVDVMLADVEHEPGALPLLSHALLETWNNRRGRTMTFGGYYAAGGVKGAIAQRADTEFGELSPEEQAVARNIFVRLTELGEGSEDTRRRVARAELLGTGKDPETVANVLATLGYARLISVDRDEVEVAHEALIREWPRLRLWLEDDREGLRLHRRLTETAKEWDEAGRKESDLYRGTRLDQTLEWAASNVDSLNDLERAFLDASQAQVEADLREKERVEQEREEARQRQIEQAQALAAEAEARRGAEEERALEAEARAAEESKARNRTKWALGAALIAFALAAVVGWFLYRQNLDLQGARLLSEARAAREAREVEAAIAKFQEAAIADPTLGIDVAKEISETLRYAALHLIYEGEELAAQGDASGAQEKFENALALNPPSDTPVYVWIEEGDFRMGSDPSVDAPAQEEDELEQHTVPLDGFWIMRTEVTNELYARCVISGPCEPPSNERWHRTEYAREPVTNVDWHQAGVYAEWVGGRLPTEAEWEKACRGTDGALYSWGNEEPDPARLNYYRSGLNGVVPAGSYPPGAYDLYDMAGNVWEWTSSKYVGYPYDPDDGRESPEGDDRRTLRGGAWRHSDDRVRCAYRGRLFPNLRYDNYGFRVVWSPGS